MHVGKLSFNVVIFVAALWALSSETIEDSIVNLIYGHIFGWRTLIYALLTGSAILVSVSALVVLYASVFLQSYVGLIVKGAAVLLGLVGVFWLARSVLGKEDEVEEASARKGNFVVALQLV